MNISRKDFFRTGLFSLGDTVCALTGMTSTPAAPAPEPENGGREFVPTGRPDLVALADNGLCLARNCGCFACIERCDARAIHLVFGTGVRIDGDQCTGCGSCAHVCPVTPKASSLRERVKSEG
jgi:NAD-dependent dihydropyrimidine dehydrogenase PreA subunit